MRDKIITTPKQGLGNIVVGNTLVLQSAFSARYDVNISTGTFSRVGIAPPDVSIKDKILVADRAKGGVSTSWILREMQRLGTAPRALVFNHAGPVMVQAAAFANIPILDGFTCDITEFLQSNTLVCVSPKQGTITIQETL